MQVATRNSANKEAFFASWPQLRTHEAIVGRIAAVYRQLNPQATREQMIAEVGLQAAHMAKVAPVPQANAAGSNGSRPAAGVSHQPQPFQPASGLSPAIAPSGNEGDPWGFLGQDE